MGEGVHDEYKKNAHSQCDVLFRVSIKGRKVLSDDIPLHMSLKCFNSKNEFTVEEVKKLVKDLDLDIPDLSKAKLKTTIFTNEKTGNKYYMLILENIGDAYKKFYDHFKNRGVTHKKFFAHITIDKKLYDDINKNGIEPKDIKFFPLMIEHGAGNDVYTFDEMEKSENMNKGLKHIATALGAAGTLLSSSPTTATNVPQQKPAIAQAAKPAPAPKPMAAPKVAAPAQKPMGNLYSSKRMLRTIADVESSGGKFTHHKPLVEGINAGESAYGKYALTPNVIRETIKMHPDLRHKYGKGVGLKGKDLVHFMQDNPGLEDKVATYHLKRLEHHFGKNPAKLGYAWLEGIRGTYRAMKQGRDIPDHWHVKKIRAAYGKEK